MAFITLSTVSSDFSCTKIQEHEIDDRQDRKDADEDLVSGALQFTAFLGHVRILARKQRRSRHFFTHKTLSGRRAPKHRLIMGSRTKNASGGRLA